MFEFPYDDGPDEYQFCEECGTVMGFVNHPFWQCELCGALYLMYDLSLN